MSLVVTIRMAKRSGPRLGFVIKQSRATRSCGLVEARPEIVNAANAELGVRFIRYQGSARHVVPNGVLTGGEGNSRHPVASGWCV